MNRNAPEPRDLFAIADLAKEFGISTRAIRFYESKGLLQPERVGGTRIFRRRDRARLILILRGKRLGFSLRDISDYLSLYDAHSQTAQVELLVDKVEERLALLEAQKRDLETTIAELWQQVLCVEAVGIDEPFFQLGGRSLQLMPIHAGLERTFGRKIDVAEMFSRPTVRELAQLIEAPTAERPVPDEARLRADKRRAAMARRAGLPARVMAR